MKSLEEKRIEISDDNYLNPKIFFYYKEEDVVLVVAELRKEIKELLDILEENSPTRWGCGFVDAIIKVQKIINRKFGCEKPIKDKVSIKCQYGN